MELILKLLYHLRLINDQSEDVGYNHRMIRTVHGQVTEVRAPEVVIEVAGIGYLIHTNRAADTLPIGSPALFHTYLAVRETALDLYGFETRDELEVFQHLISLPKIGPKTALQIMLQADITLIKDAVANDDPVRLSKLSGIGKKSAEKIVSGLREKFDDDALAESSASRNAGADHTSDTIDALISLGYPATDARRVTIQITSENPDVSTSAEALKLALKILNTI